MVIYSDDGGDTWEKGGSVPAAFDLEGQLVNANECQVGFFILRTLTFYIWNLFDFH